MKKSLILLALFFIATPPLFAEKFWLISPAEYQQKMPKMLSKGLFGADPIDKDGPSIELLSPSINKGDTLASPMRIELSFNPKEGAKILPSSFKVTYDMGMLELDITDRILGQAEVTPSGLIVSGAELPIGSHSITISISDDQRHTGKVDLSFTIAEG